MSRKFVVSLGAFALLVPTFAQTLPPGVVKKSSMAGITEYDYPNGLRILLYPDGSSPRITVNVTYMVGSRHEGYGETGMAHLLEHMDFIETTNGRQIKDEITAHSSGWNGSTNSDRTNYYETFVANDENLKWALGLEADRMVNVKFTKKILDTEMTVVRNEFERGENSPQSILRERVEATAYIWHNYGHPTIGSREDIERVPVERLAAFYKKFYQPDNAILAIGGRFDESKALALVAETIGKLPRPTRELDQTYTVEPPQDGERFVELRRVGTGPEVIIAYHGPAAGHPDEAAIQVLSGIMNGSGGGGGRGGRGGGGGRADGRLAKALVDSKKAQSANMGFQLRHDPGLLTVSATLTPEESLDEAKKAIFEALADVEKNPPTMDEIAKVRDRLLKNIEDRMSNTQSFTTGLSEPIADGDWRLMFLEHDRLKDVSPQDIVRVAKLYLKESNRTIGYYIPTDNPERTVVPEAPDLNSTLANYKSTVTIAHGESFDPTPANIEGRLTRAKLANGMKLVELNKATTENMVFGEIELRFGDAASLAGKAQVARYAESELGGGTTSRTRQQIQAELEKLNARVSVGGGGGGGGRGGRGGGGGGAAGGGLTGATATIQAPAANFVAAMRIAVDELRNPAYPAEDFDRAKQQNIRALSQPRTEPTQLSAEILQRHLSPYPKGDPRYSGTPEDQVAEIQKVTLDDVKKFHQQFYGASHAVMAIVGPIDKDVVQKAAAELLGSWTSPAPFATLKTVYAKAAPIDQKIETPDKANAQFEAGLRFQMSQNDSDYAAMVLANYMFGGSITARMPNRIRNCEGLSYGASSRLQIPAEGDSAMLSATVSENPVNTPKVEFSFTDELAKTLKEGFTAEELETAKKAYLDAQFVARAQDASLLTLLTQHEQLGRTLQWDADLETKIRALSPNQITAAFRKHIDPSQVSIVKAGDFKAAKVY